jgi:hypothetical protein
MKLAAALLASAALVLAGPASADRLTRASEAAIGKLLELVAPTGERVGPARYGELATGGMMRFEVAGDRTVEYYFNAICDDTCENLDLVALDAADKELDIDDADDNAPTLNVQADLHGDLDEPKHDPRPITIEVRMKACKTEVCAFGMLVTQVD